RVIAFAGAEKDVLRVVEETVVTPPGDGLVHLPRGDPVLEVAQQRRGDVARDGQGRREQKSRQGRHQQQGKGALQQGQDGEDGQRQQSRLRQRQDGQVRRCG